MSASLYRYTEDCDGVPCPGDCDMCNRNEQSSLFGIEEKPRAQVMKIDAPYTMPVKLDRGARMPTRAHNQDAGLDLYSREDAAILPHKGCVFDTGVHIALPPMYYGKIESKSGLNVNHDVVSCGGVIDEGYTGSIRVKLYNLGDAGYMVHKGDKIAQMIIMPYATPPMKLTYDLEETERGDSGFGSTGR